MKNINLLLFCRLFVLTIATCLIFASCGGDSVSSHDEPNSSGLQSSAGESSSSSVENDESSSSVLSVSSAEESSSSMEEVSSSSDEISSSESSSSSSSMSRDLSDCLMYWGETECKACLELSSSSLQISLGEMIDERDGHVYKTMTIDGKATWMAENLNYAYLQPTSTLDSSSWCYENEPDSCAKYGRLYLWSAAMDSAGLFSPDAKGCGYYAERENWYECPASNVRGVCPEHWHVPSSSEFSVPLLLAKRYVPCGPYSYGIGPDKYEYFGNTITAPNDLLSVEWSNPYQQWSEEDRDEMGFNLLPAGIYYAGDDWFEYNYSWASLWFSDEKNGSMAKSISLPQLIPEGAYDPRTAYEKNWAFPLRCVKDEVEE